MISRFVLVGLVATLGISIPTRNELVSCVGVLHEWMANGLASLDASTHRTSPPGLRDWTPNRPRRNYTPIEPTLTVVGIVDELNRMSDGIEVPPLPSRPRSSGTARSAFSRSKVFSFVTNEENFVANTEDMLVRSALPATSMSRLAMEKRHSCPARGESHCSFSPGLFSTVRVTPPWEPIEASTDSSADIATVLNRFAEGLDLTPTRRHPLATVTDVERVFESLPFAGPVVPDRSSLAAEPSPRLTSYDEARLSPSPEFTRALGLTSQALKAWIRVLNAPGELRISSR